MVCLFLIFLMDRAFSFVYFSGGSSDQTSRHHNGRKIIWSKKHKQQLNRDPEADLKLSQQPEPVDFAGYAD